MSTTLHVSEAALAAALGWDCLEQLTYPGIYRGATHNAAPVVLMRDGEPCVVVNEADSDACRALAGRMAVRTYGRYFAWGKPTEPPPSTFAEAVRGFAGEGAILCESVLPVSRYRALAEGGAVTLLEEPAGASPAGVHLYRKSRAEIAAQWEATRTADAAAFAPFVAGLPHGARLVAALRRPAVGYAPLEALCAERGVAALLVTAPYEVEMFCGLPAKAVAQAGLVALFDPSSPDVLLCARETLCRADFRPAGEAADLAAALRGHAPRRLGCVFDDLPARDWLALQAAGFEPVDAAYVLRRWQDRRAGDDFVYFVLAAQAVLAGFAAARDLRARGGELRERDLMAACRLGAERFARRWGFGGRISSYFDIIHTGARTLLPATAADYPVHPRDRTVKFDLGVVVTDAFGCARAVSDIARTLCVEPDLARMRDALHRLILEEIIPAIHPGMSGAEVHAVAVEKLRPLEPELRRAGMLPPGGGVEGYQRDCGHTIQRQTISAVYFLPGVTERVECGMLGCVEFVWPIGDILIAVEDGYLVTPEGTIPFTGAGELP